ncbi:hypothetical protein [Flavobacterium koreense]
MTEEELIKVAKEILTVKNDYRGLLFESLEFLRIYAGEKSAFYKQISQISLVATDSFITNVVNSTMNAYIRFLEKGLADGVSIERKAQIDVVSDFLEQANKLINSKDVHPAAPTVLIGASLEEFLRNWIEEKGLSIGQSKPSIDSYSKTLREAELITKQDFKDITSWAGLRNHAAHGQWSEIEDKRRINLMLEGVNLFMRKYGME